MKTQLGLWPLLAVMSVLLLPSTANAQTMHPPVTVPAVNAFTDTGIPLTVGETVNVTATGTVVTGGNIPGWFNNSPDGAPLPQCEIGKSGSFPLPSAPCFSLIGAISQTGKPASCSSVTCFPVGSDVTFAATAGELYLGVNDDYLPDNSGSWTAAVTTFSSSDLVLSCPLPSRTILTATVFYTATCTAYGGTPPYVWQSIANLPNGLTPSPNNSIETISGTPTAGGPYSFTIGVNDSSTPFQNQSQTYQGTVGTLVIGCTPTTGPPQENVSYTASCTASGGTPPYTWSTLGACPNGSEPGCAVPAGLSLNSTTGTPVSLGGSPTAGGGYSYAVQVTDSSSPAQTASQDYNGIVGNLMATCNPATGPVQVGVSYATTCTATDVVTGLKLPDSYTWSIVNGSLPMGLSLSATTGASITISGTPSVAGPFNYAALVTDSINPTETFTTPAFSGTIMPSTTDLVSSAQSLSFSGQAGGAQPASQSLSISSSGAALTFTAAATSTGNWLSVTPTSSSTTPATLTVSVNTAGLAAGQYSGTVTLTSAGAGNSPFSITVTLNVTPGSTTVSVPGNQLWTDAGVALVAGETVTMTASGSIYVGGRIPAWENVTPSGVPLPQCGVGKQSPFPAANLACFSLMGAISGAGTPASCSSVTCFEVGDSVTFTAAVSGELYLGVNDNGVGNNTGKWTAVATVYPQPQLVLGCQPPPSPTLTATVSYTAICTAYGGTAPYNWSIVNGSLPNGLSLSAATGSTVTISGAPTAGGQYNYAVQLTDSSTPAQNGTLAYSGTIGTLVISCATTTGTPPVQFYQTGPAQVGVPYSANCSASGGTQPYTWSIVDGSAPAGVGLSSTSGTSITVSGSPTETEAYSYNVQVADSSTPPQTNSIGYDGLVGNLSLTCTTQNGPVQVGVSYTDTCIAANGTPLSLPYAFAIVNGTLPAGLTYTPTSTQIIISGAPSAPGPYSYTVQLTDNNNPTETVVQSYSGNITLPVLPNLVATPTSLTFNYQQSGPQPSAQTLTISSSGASLSFSAAASVTTPQGGNWLSVTPTSGDTTAGLSVSVNTAGLTPGNYSGIVTLTSAGASNSGLQVPVSLTVSGPPNLGVTSTSLTFSYQQNGTQPSSQTVTVSSSTSSIPLSFTPAASVTSPAGGTWLSVTPSSSSTPATLTVSVNPAGLGAGSYSGMVTLTSANAGNSGLQVMVTLNVTVLPNLVPSPALLTFSYPQGGSAPASQMLALSSSSSTVTALSFTAAASVTSPAGGSWLSVSPTSGTTPASLTVSAAAGLAAGSYSGTVTVTSAGAGNPLTVPVTLNVLPNLVAAPTSVTFTYQQGGAQPGPQAVALSSSSSSVAAVSFTTSVSTSSGGNWLSASATSGTTPASITVSVNTSGLLPGNMYNGTVTVTSSGAGNSPFAIPVTLNIPALPNLVAAPSPMTFTFQQGGPQPASQTLSISSSSSASAAISFTAAVTSSGGVWLQATPTGGTTPASLTVSVNTANLAAGTYNGTITLTSASAGNSGLIVPVSLTVIPLGSLVVSPLMLPFGTYSIGGAAPQSQMVSVTSSSASSVLSFNVVPGNGCSWLGMSSNSAVTPATLTATVNTAGLTPQVYNCTFTLTGGSGTAPQVTASLTVVPGSFTVMPSSLTFAYQATSATVVAPAPQNITVSTSQFTYMICPSPNPSCPWLSASLASGSATTLSVSVNPTNLTVGTYNGSVAIASGGTTQNVFVTLTVSGPTLAPSVLQSFTYVAGGAAPAPQSLTISSSNSQLVTFTASSACPWLNPLPTGTLQTGTGFPLTPNATALASGSYPPGTYNCSLTIASPQASSSLTVPLTLSVSPANVTVCPATASSNCPATVAFNAGLRSTSPLLRSVAVNAPAPVGSAPPVTFTASVTGCPTSSWLSVSPTTGNAPATLTLQADPSGLTASPAACQLTVTPSQGQQPKPLNVTLTISAQPTLIVAPGLLSFRFPQNPVTGPQPQVVSVLAGGNVPIKFNATTTGVLTGAAGAVQKALQVSTPAGSGNVTVSVNSTLPAGYYTGTITVTSAQTNPGTQTVPVDVLVDAPPPATPVLTVAPAALTFAFSSTGNGNGASQLLRLVNQGSGSPAVTASASTGSGGDWLSATLSASQVTGTAPVSVAVTANPAAIIPNASGQVAGTYTGKVVLTSPGLPTETIPVTMTVAALPIVQISRTGLAYKVVLDGNEAPPQSVYILNPGTGTLNWSAQAGANGCGPWLTFPGVAKGSVSAGSPDQLLIALNGTAVQSQAPGTYYCSVVVSATSAATGQPVANNHQTVTVVLNVLQTGTYVSPFVQPAGFALNGAAGSTVQTVQATIVSLSQQPVTYSSATVTGDGGGWCTVSPDTGVAADGASIEIAANYTALSAKSAPYTCTVQLSFSDGSLQTVSLFAVVTGSVAAPASAGSAQPRTSVHPRTQGCTPNPPVFLNPSAASVATAYQPTEVDLQILDSCGNAIDSQDIGVLGLFATYSGGNNDPAGDFKGPYETSPGVYKFEWTPTSMPQNVSQSAVTLTAAYTSSVANITPQPSYLPVTVSLAPSPTRIDPDGVSNAASYTSQMAVGAIIAVFGQNLADTGPDGSCPGQQAGGFPLPVDLNGAAVFVDGQKVPLFYASCSQINAQIPYNLETNSPHQLYVVRDDLQQANPQAFTLVGAEPAIFTFNASGSGQGIIIGPGPDQSYTTIANAANPAAVGDVVVIYCAGLGPVTPVVDAGVQTPPTPYHPVPPGLTVTIGNVPAPEISYAGLSPYFVGLYQVNVKVPVGVKAANDVPVVITSGNLQSQPGVTMAVQSQSQ